MNRFCPDPSCRARIRRGFVFLAALLSMLGVSASSAGAADPEEIRIGCILYLTGDLAMQENAMREGIELARDELNARGGVRGRTITLIVEDTRNDPKLGVAASKKFLSVDRVHAALISSYQDAMSSGPLYEQAHVPAVTLWDATPEIDAVGEYVFSIGPWIPSAGESAADYLWKTLKASSVVTVNTEEQWSQSVTDYFTKRFTSLGGKVLSSMQVPPDLADFGTVVSKLRSAKADALYVPLTYNILPFHKRLRALGWTLPVVSSDIITDELIRQSPETFEGVYQTGINDPSSPEFAELAKQYSKRYGRGITLPWFVATGFDSLNLVAHAAEAGGVSGPEIKDALSRTKGFKGAARTYTMNERGAAPDFERMFRITGGKLAPVS